MSEQGGCLKDTLVIVGTLCALDVIEIAFGRAVAFAVATTSLIAIVLFFWHAGKDVPRPTPPEDTQ